MVSAVTVPFNFGAGSTIVVSDTTANQGSGMVAASVTRFYLSTQRRDRRVGDAASGWPRGA